MTLAFLLIISGILIAYIFMQAMYAFAWLNYPHLGSNTLNENSAVTILIAFRNEAQNLDQCLNGIINQSYPLENLQILLLNDHSVDDSVKSIQRYLEFPHVRLINMPDQIQGKKQSIAFGLNEVRTPFVLFTDADCVAGVDWVRELMNNMISLKADAICGPVEVRGESTILEQFQALDFAGMMAITAVAMKCKWFYLANGANLLLRMEGLDMKTISWQEEYASGDDMSLVAHLQKKNGKIGFAKNKSAIVSTLAQSGLRDFFHQRLRWGTKNKSNNNPLMIVQLGLAYLASIVSVMAIIGIFFNLNFLYIVILKLLGDIILLSSTASYFNKQAYLIKLPLFSIMHSTYIALIGTLSLLPLRYQWKGRIVK